MDGRPPPQRDDPPLALLVRGCLGIALALGGLVLGGTWGQGIIIAGTATTVWGAVLFPREALTHFRARRRE